MCAQLPLKCCTVDKVSGQPICLFCGPKDVLVGRNLDHFQASTRDESDKEFHTAVYNAVRDDKFKIKYDHETEYDILLDNVGEAEYLQFEDESGHCTDEDFEGLYVFRGIHIYCLIHMFNIVRAEYLCTLRVLIFCIAITRWCIRVSITGCQRNPVYFSSTKTRSLVHLGCGSIRYA